jgi:hypothetical protein
MQLTSADGRIFSYAAEWPLRRINIAVAGRQVPADAKLKEIDMAARQMPRLKQARRPRRIRPSGTPVLNQV